MNYKKIYKDLVTSRKNRMIIEGEYYEKHHIIPKCVGSKDKSLVNLTAREHFIAHWLLTKMFMDEIITRKMLFAFGIMRLNGNGQGRNLSSWQFEKARKAFSKVMTGKSNPNYGKKFSNETRKKMSKIKKGRGNPMYGKHHTEKTKKKLRLHSTGKKHSEETKRKISENHADFSGKNNPMYGILGKDHPLYGRKHTKETIRKMSEIKRGKKFSEEHKKKLSECSKRENLSGETRRKMSEAKSGENNGNAKIWTFIYNDVEITIKSLKTWCKENNYKYNTAKWRIHRNLSI